MELHQLRYVVAVAEAGSFTRAAERLFLAQPSLSVQVAKLEQELGIPLFERLGRRVELTAAGRVFLEHAERALAELEQGRRRVDDVRGVRLGRVAVGVLPSVGAGLLPEVLVTYRAEHPGVEVTTLEQDVSAEFERMVHGGQLDLAVIRMPNTRKDLDAAILIREPLVVLVPPEHRLRQRRQVHVRDLADLDFVAMRRSYGLRDLMDRVCARAGFEPRVTAETGQLSIIWALVRAGIGISLLPGLAAGRESTLPVVERYAYRELGVVWRAGQPLAPAAQRFRDLLLAAAAGLPTR